MTTTRSVVELVAAAAGSPDRVLGGVEREAWAVGGRVPEAVVFPESPEETAAILATASEEGVAVVPAGAGGWLGGGGPPRAGRIVLSTRRMDGIEEYVPGDLTLTAGAGLGLGALDRAARENGQWFPQDPPGWPEATLGAMVATGIQGPLSASFGRPRDQLLGLTLVTGDGRIVRPGGRVVKNVAGYDLVRLAAGSWGALGVVVGATVRLFPVPEVERTLLWRGPEASALVPPARALATAAVLPGALELLAPGPGAGVDGGATLALRALGSRESVEEQARIFLEASGRDPDETLSGEASRTWHRRRSEEEGLGGPGGGAGPALQLRLTLLPDRLGDLVGLADELARAVEAEEGSASCRIHVTRGVARIALGGLRAGEAPEGWIDRLSRLRERVEERGGSLAAVAGPDDLLEELARSPSGPVARLMDGLKDAFDPAGILAPGRRVP